MSTSAQPPPASSFVEHPGVRALLAAALDGVVIMDADGMILAVNHALCEALGATEEQLVGAEVAVVMVPPELREAHRAGVVRAVRTNKQHMLHGNRVEIPAQRLDGTPFTAELTVTRPDVPGPPIYCGYVRDLTERNRADRALRELVEEHAAVRRVAEAVAAGIEREPLFALVTAEVGGLLGASSSNMVAYDETGAPFAKVVGAWDRGGARSIPLGSDVELDDHASIGRVWRTGRPARVDDYAGADGPLAARVQSLDIHAAVAAPIHVGGRLWGAVVVSSVSPEPFPPGAEHRVGDFAQLVSQALANAEAHRRLAASAARIVEAGDTERRRLERNLHDGAQQRLIALAVALRLVERRLDDDDPGGARTGLAHAIEELQQSLAELRELARGIHPAVLTEHGLVIALEGLASRQPLPVRLSIGIDDRLPEPVEAAAYYVVSEALANVAKYARASAAEVTLLRRDGLLHVAVADDGVGGARPDGGSGLRGLADRVAALGGHFEVGSPAGAGTTVRARIPVRA